MDVSDACLLTTGFRLPLLELLQLLELLELLFFRQTAAVVASYKLSCLLYPLCGGTLDRRDVDPVPGGGATHQHRR